MNYPRIFFIFGLVVVLIPFLGVPLIWKHILTIAIGFAIVSFAILLRSVLRAKKPARPTPATVRRAQSVSQQKSSFVDAMKAAEPVPVQQQESVVVDSASEQSPAAHDES